MNDNITIYEANARHKTGFFKVWVIMIRNIILSKDLIMQLFKRDFLAAYKKSFLGIAWIFISPVFGILSWVFMNSTGILKPGDMEGVMASGDVNQSVVYPAFVLISTNIWGLFIGFYQTAAGTLKAGTGFILQVNYPHEVLLIKQLANYLAVYILSFLLVVGIILAFGIIPDWKIILFPILILPLFFLGSAIGLMISVTTAVTEELNNITIIILGLMLFITPVIYSPNVKDPLVQEIIRWNPLTYLVGGTRDLILKGTLAHPYEFYAISFASMLVFMFAWRLFYISENKVIERMI